MDFSSQKGSWLELPNELCVLSRCRSWRTMLLLLTIQRGRSSCDIDAGFSFASASTSSSYRPGQMMMASPPRDGFCCVCGWSWNGVYYNNKITRKILQFKSQSHLHPCVRPRRCSSLSLAAAADETCRSHTMFFHTQSNPFRGRSPFALRLLLFTSSL